jgi:serine phosphatase RsbU (regulator of sigma subunit)
VSREDTGSGRAGRGATVVHGTERAREASTSEVIREIARASDLPRVLEAACEGARSLIGTHQAAASRTERGWAGAHTYVSLSDKYAAYRAYAELPQGLGLPSVVTGDNTPLRLTAAELAEHPGRHGLADVPDHPPLPDLLAAPFVGRDGSNLGLIQLSDKVDGTPFTEADEALLVQIATTTAGVIEHLELAVELERNIRKHRLVADVAVAFASTGALGDMLRRTVKALVDHLDAPLARLWLVNDDLEQLELQASAGAVVSISGPEMRIGIGDGVIGGIADRRQPYTADHFGELNDVWAADGKGVAFAGLPLMVEDRCIGVLCMSTSRPLTVNAMTALQATAETAALGIDRVRQERATVDLLTRERRIRSDLDHALRRVDLMHTIGRSVLRRIEVDEIVEMVIEAAVELTPASVGAFFYNQVRPDGETYDLYRVAGVDASVFDGFGMPRNTPLFAPTFAGERIVRSDDVTREPEFGREAPYFGFPEGHLPVRSYLAVPVRLSSTDVVGGMFFAHPEPGRFSENDETIVSALADYAGIAIDNARLLRTLEVELEERSKILEERDRVANVLQASLLPPTLPEIPGVDLGAAYQGGQASVGGDFYDMFPLADDDWFIVLGDVCGKGALAAARTAVARHSVRTGALLRREPDAALRVLNRALLIDESRDQRSRFVSAVALRIEIEPSHVGGVEVEAATGGHHPPLIRRADGTVEPLDVSGTILGVFDDPRIGIARTRLDPGDLLVLYTDGVIEARSVDGEVYGEERLRDLLRSGEHRSAGGLAAAIRREAAAFADAGSRDDIAVVVVGPSA